LSSRQAQIKVVDVRYIVTDLDLNQTATGGGVTTGGIQAGGGAVGSAILPLAEPIELGPVLDIVPYVSADGYTIQMTIIPTLKEFVGYDDETARKFQAQAQSVGGAAAPALTQQVPLPIFRLRQVVTSAVVWDGQTVVLGGLISENVTKMKDKVPVLGDLPLAGRFFRSESFATKKKNLLIFVTPTIIDPAGNRVHTDEELPFAQSSIPPQRPSPPAP
jgi:general secretion pathway protein D